MSMIERGDRYAKRLQALEAYFDHDFPQTTVLL